ncbi:MAG: Wzy polymerase domain-containing protein [Hydrogenophaga sp.]|uniref:PglL family O-oligosaccharyltransferase n=1 Tax=Hydrogenophaga sp. TaxID=1904254 RepID=UPI0026390FA8|nr:O-antigen ligase family protein [Hydrogenophaga sp.]MCV0438602.1 Wzy polymerase domain-containing protein [Hydrogenophaga sp.]
MTQIPHEKKNAPLGRFSLLDLVPITVSALFLAGWLTTSHISPWVSWHAEVPFFFAVLLAAWVAVAKAIFIAPNSRIAFPISVWPFLFLFLVGLLQWAAGSIVFFGDLFVFGLYLSLCVISISLGYGLMQPSLPDVSARAGLPYSVLLALTLIVGGVASVAVALAQVLEVWKTASWILPIPGVRRPGANLGQPNHLSTLIVMALASAIFLHGSRWLGNRVLLLLMVFLTAGLAVTESRTGALSFIALIGWWCWKQPQITPKASRLWVAPIVALFAAMFLLWPAALAMVRVSSGALGVRLGDAIKEGRMDVWPQLIAAALEKPWWGWGIHQTAEAHNAVAHLYQKSLPFTYSHNIVIDLILWVGLPITCLLMFVAGVWALRRMVVVQSPLSWFGFAVLLPLAVHSMLEFPFSYSYLLVPAMLGVGAMERALDQGKKFQLGLKPASVTLLIATTFSAWSVWEYVQVEKDFQVARFELLRIGQVPEEHRPPKIRLLTQLDTLTAAARIEPGPDLSLNEMLTLKRAALGYPWSGTQYRYALALALKGEAAEAERQLQVIQVLHGEKISLKFRAEIEKKLKISVIH